MKKVIAFIKLNAPLIYFVNQVHRHTPIHTVVIEDKHLGDLSALNRIKRKIALGASQPAHPHVTVRIKTSKAAALYTRVFGQDWLDLDRSIQVVYCRNINDPVVEELLQREQPDLLLDHGTSIVKDTIIEKVPLALNLHWGLSPYYRGTHCTEWALINWDPRNIGVTIHRLTKKIDGGDLLCQTRVEPEADDSVDSINMKLTSEGTRIVIEALALWRSGNDLVFHEQDHSLGYLTLNRQWNRSLRATIENIEKNNLIAKMIRTPARKERLPIISL